MLKKLAHSQSIFQTGIPVWAPKNVIKKRINLLLCLKFVSIHLMDFKGYENGQKHFQTFLLHSKTLQNKTWNYDRDIFLINTFCTFLLSLNYINCDHKHWQQPIKKIYISNKKEVIINENNFKKSRFLFFFTCIITCISVNVDF